jgi:NitT/TauT family transport system substrate-binding protein
MGPKPFLMQDADDASQAKIDVNRINSVSEGCVSRRGFLAGTGVATVGALGGCMGITDTDPDTVTFGTLTIPAVSEVLVAKDSGYFEDRDIELEIERIQSAPKATPKLATGDLDVATGSIGASLFNSIAQDVDVRVVADNTQFWPGQAAVRILARADAVPDTDSIYDLPEGLNIALHGKGNVDSYQFARILALNDLTWDDMETTEMFYNHMASAMAEGGIDACAIPDPLGLQVLDKADAKPLGYGSMVAPRLQVASYIFGGPFADDNPDTATRWLEAYLEGVREYHDLGGSLSKEVARIVNEELDLPVPLVRSSIPSIPHKNGHLNAESIENQQAYHACRGTVETMVDMDDVVDESYLEDALDTVGRVDSDEATPSREKITEWEESALSPYPPAGEIRTPDEFPTDSTC